jgi:hypothetical protein
MQKNEKNSRRDVSHNIVGCGLRRCGGGKADIRYGARCRGRCAHAGAYSRANTGTYTGTYAGTDAGAHTIFEIRAYRKYVL